MKKFIKKKIKDYSNWVCSVCGIDNRDCKCGNINY